MSSGSLINGTLVRSVYATWRKYSSTADRPFCQTAWCGLVETNECFYWIHNVVFVKVIALDESAAGLQFETKATSDGARFFKVGVTWVSGQSRIKEVGELYVHFPSLSPFHVPSPLTSLFLLSHSFPFPLFPILLLPLELKGKKAKWTIPLRSVGAHFPFIAFEAVGG